MTKEEDASWSWKQRHVQSIASLLDAVQFESLVQKENNKSAPADAKKKQLFIYLFIYFIGDGIR